MVVGFCLFLMVFFVPETFWDRTPRPRSKLRKQALASLSKIFSNPTRMEWPAASTGGDGSADMRKYATGNAASSADPHRVTIAERRQNKIQHHVGFAGQVDDVETKTGTEESNDQKGLHLPSIPVSSRIHSPQNNLGGKDRSPEVSVPGSPASHSLAANVTPRGEGPRTPGLHSFNSPYYVGYEKPDTDYMNNEHEEPEAAPETPGSVKGDPGTTAHSEKSPVSGGPRYTAFLRTQPPKPYRQTLKLWNGRLCQDDWLKVAFRPFILFAYPSILWSTLVYSLSIGWLIVLSESVTVIFQNKDTYNFTALQTGLVYISPFVGGVLGTAVAGKVSDVIVRSMSRRNGGIYEPEFRLVMAIPITLSTCIGLMGYGWSAEERDNFIVPTVFFGIISFGCALGSTTAITFAVDSYRQYAGEALVTLNFSKSKSHCTSKGDVCANVTGRHLPRSSLLPLLQPLARSRRREETLCSYWRHSASLSCNNRADVCIWKTGQDVDCEEEFYGEVLKIAKMRVEACWISMHSRAESEALGVLNVGLAWHLRIMNCCGGGTVIGIARRLADRIWST